jgi:hypothetical protein
MKMHRYVKQLLEDLETAAANPPAPPCIEILHDFEIDPWIGELALAPLNQFQNGRRRFSTFHTPDTTWF